MPKLRSAAELHGARMAKMRLFRCIRQIAAACVLAIAIAVAIAPVAAQQRTVDGAPNPTGSVVNERTLLKQAPRVEGRIDIPDTKASVLIQPAGRQWDYFHQVTLHWLGGIVILGMIAALGFTYLIMGPLRVSAGRSGQKISRFSAFERFSHWLTAVSFVILGLTGLNITFGKLLLLPLIGPEAYSNLSAAAKYMHNFISFSFVVGLALIVAKWLKDNIPSRVDIDWLKQGGGFIRGRHAPAGRFNAGEKLVFWFALGAGAAVIVSGYMLLFPFYLSNIAGMQIAQVVHAVVAMLFVAVIIAHIYIGTVGMEGAFEAMGTGAVDLNWAKEHHDLWLRDRLAVEQPRGQKTPSAAPAE